LRGGFALEIGTDGFLTMRDHASGNVADTPSGDLMQRK